MKFGVEAASNHIKYSKKISFEMQNSNGKKNASPSCKYQWILLLGMSEYLWKWCKTQDFWKMTDETMCKFPRVAIGAGTLFS